ncbi:MAG: hypothetical protein ICV78_27410, partial [Tolypothrix sp. Co-bin9]|nr:hypothetical protein [Tolypothrix sp. Co-bin9]
SYDVPQWQLNSLAKGSSITKLVAEAKSGLKPGKVEQFVRLLWEEPFDRGTKKKWNYLQNGGEYAPYFYSTYLVVFYEKDWKQLKLVPSSRITGVEDYFKCGITYGKRTDYIYGYPMPAGQIFSNEGMAVFPKQLDKYWTTLSLINSSSIQTVMNRFAGQHKAHSYFNKIHLFTSSFPKELAENAKKIVSILYGLDRYVETSTYFEAPPSLDNAKLVSLEQINEWIVKTKDKIKEAEHLYRVNNKIASNCLSDGTDSEDKLPNWEYIIFRNSLNHSYVIKSILSYSFGICISAFQKKEFGKMNEFDPQIVLNELPEEHLLSNVRTKPPVIQTIFEISTVSKSKNIQAFTTILNEYAPVLVEFSQETLKQELGYESIIEFFSKSQGFFDYHLNLYSRGRREAPIYWPLQTPSGSYTLWVYYHRINEQTLYTCVNDFIEPKLKAFREELSGLRNKSTRSSAEEKELVKLTDLEAELKDFRDELLRLAKFWKPNLDDGVQITAAPLWKLFQHRQWQKKLKETWEKLEDGEYDWAHIARSIWPERVLRKCYQDRSLAIAHDVEDDFWEEVEIPVKHKGKGKGEIK